LTQDWVDVFTSARTSGEETLKRVRKFTIFCNYTFQQSPRGRHVQAERQTNEKRTSISTRHCQFLKKEKIIMIQKMLRLNI